MVFVYKDIISQAEMVDDNMTLEEIHGGHILEVKSNMITDPDNDEEEVQVKDVVHNFRYSEFTMEKPAFMAYIKNYLKAIKTHLEKTQSAEYVKSFEKNAGDFVKFLIPKFKDVEFYRNEKTDCVDGAIAIGVWKDESDAAPTFYYFKDGLTKEKC